MAYWLVIDNKTSIAINRIYYETDEIVPKPNQSYPDSTMVKTDTAQVGWKYTDGVFIEPPPPPIPTYLQPPTLESIQAQMAALQAQLATLMAAAPVSTTPAASSS